MKYNTLEEFLTHQKLLLDLEHKTELEQQTELYESKSLPFLENKGLCVRKPYIEHHKTGLYGRLLVTFSTEINYKTEKGGEMVSSMQNHRLTSGDIVGVYPNKGENNEQLSSGVVSSVRGTKVVVAFSEDFDMAAYPMYRLMLLTNEVTYRRLKRALESLQKLPSSAPCSSIINSLFPCQRIASASLKSDNVTDFFSSTLDQSQQDAVRFVFDNKEKISVIHGPPGTGKTTTIVEVVQQAVKCRSMKVLVCAPSNIAVDNLLQKLSKTGVKVVRLGHPARVTPELQKHSLDAILMSRESSNIIRSVRSDITSAIGKLKKCKGKSEVFPLRREVKELRKELVAREAKAISEVLSGAEVVLSTANSAANDGPLKHVGEDHFDLLIIDEAGQALEISCWVPLLMSPRLILVGDHKQLPPTIISQEASAKGLAFTLLERVVEELGENIVSMLTTQYRMHESIMRWPSQQLYDDKLIAAECVAGHLLCDIEGVQNTPDTSVPLVFLDTAGFNLHELSVGEDESKGNEWEVGMVKEHIDALVSAGVNTNHIGVITPYNLQVKMIRACIINDYPGVEVHSVDGFQGREKEAIVISMVRSNEKGEIGFLSEDRRMNVALTRARRHLFVVGDSQTASHHSFLHSMCKYLQQHGDLRTPNSTLSHDTITVTASSDDFLLPTAEAVLRKGELRKNVLSGKKIDPFEKEKYSGRSSSKESDYKCQKDNPSSSYVQTSLESLDIGTDSKSSKVVVSMEQIFQMIQEFSEGAETELVFPSTLSAKERAYVHEVSEQWNLNHVSSGEGGNRKIVVSKMLRGTASSRSFNTKAKEDGHMLCDVCSTNVPSANYQLHQIRCQKIGAVRAASQKDNEEKARLTKKTKAASKNKKKENSENNEEEDIDLLLDAFAKEVSQCNFLKCKNPIKVLGHRCDFCSQMYCTTHHMAEVHGCGEAAKIRARQDISKYKGNVPHKMNDIKKSQVQNKLNSKLTKLEEQRKKKAKENK